MRLLIVRHVTRYSYHRPVALADHRMMLRPRDSYDMRTVAASLRITPQPVRIRWLHDVFNNSVAIASFEGETSELAFESDVALEHLELDMPLFAMDERASRYPFAYDPRELPDLAMLIGRQHMQYDIDNWAKRFVGAGDGGPLDLLHAMTASFKADFTYERREESGVQTPADTLAKRAGSCRDFAFLRMEGVRSLGFAARFVSGYIFSPTRSGKRARIGGGSTHAWLQVYLPGAGWIEFDPTNNIVGNRDLIRVAVARDPSQARPLSGAFIGEPSAFRGMEVVVEVTARGAAPEPIDFFAQEQVT